MTFTFKTTEFAVYTERGNQFYGIRTFTVDATSVQDAWNKVREIEPKKALERLTPGATGV